MKHTLESIAKLAGVSRGTVSRVINGQSGVKEEVRHKVLGIIEETGYTPHPQARSLAGGKTDNIGIVFFGRHQQVLTHHIFYEVLQGIQHHSAANNYDMLLFANRSDSDKEYWKRIGTRRKVDGLIIMGENIQREYLDYYRQKHIPFVLIGKRVYDQLPLVCVTSDYRSGAHLATSHLIQQGHKRIVYIQGITDTYHEDERYAGYVKALSEKGLTSDPALRINGMAMQEAARVEMQRLIDARVPFDAVFAGNDLMALGAIEAMTEAGIRVPDDAAVVGYDDIQAAQYTSPPLTTIKQDKIKLGQEAMELLMRLIKGELKEDEAKDVIVSNDLIIRGSS